jgi:hypothetical protein
MPDTLKSASFLEGGVKTLSFVLAVDSSSFQFWNHSKASFRFFWKLSIVFVLELPRLGRYVCRAESSAYWIG